jgi:hypothetical protein
VVSVESSQSNTDHLVQIHLIYKFLANLMIKHQLYRPSPLLTINLMLTFVML